MDESLNCLNGVQWFLSLELKSGYWQVELEEESKPLTAFTVGLLRLYECKWRPFRFMNAPVTFQRLMENFLGDCMLTSTSFILMILSFFQNSSGTFIEIERSA